MVEFQDITWKPWPNFGADNRCNEIHYDNGFQICTDNSTKLYELKVDETSKDHGKFIVSTEAPHDESTFNEPPTTTTSKYTPRQLTSCNATHMHNEQ